MDVALSDAVTPPEFTLNENQKAILSDFRNQITTTLSKAQDDLLASGLEADQTLSCCFHIAMDHAASTAHLSALVDGRDPNLDWFIQNARETFERWSAAITADES